MSRIIRFATGGESKLNNALIINLIFMKKKTFLVELPNLSTETIDYEAIDDNYITDMNAPAVYSDYSSNSKTNRVNGSFFLIGFVLSLKVIVSS